MENVSAKDLWMRYLTMLQSQDPSCVDTLFTENAVFDDAARRLLGYHDTAVKGRENIRAFFQTLFSQHTVSPESVVQFGQKLFYNVHVDGKTTFAVVGWMQLKDQQIERLEIKFRL